VQRHLIFIILFASFISVTACAEPTTRTCLKYKPSKVKVIGRLFVREDFGPPNYGERPETDSKEPHIYLILDRSICVDAGDKLSDYSPAEGELKTIQLVYLARSGFDSAWLKKHVKLTGKLFHANTAHHWTPVLMVVEQTKPLP
jgi:hypothetical protein